LSHIISQRHASRQRIFVAVQRTGDQAWKDAVQLWPSGVANEYGVWLVPAVILV
jgi:hypothetical protein